MIYVALLRGIMPMNPNMRGEKLRGVFESLGFKNVKTVIASGNVIFESSSKSAGALEKKIETALPKQLGFESTTIIRSEMQLKKLVQKDPFKGIQSSKQNYLVVTFFKNGKEVVTAIDMTKGRTPEFMRDIEKKHGKQLTTRTWKTIGRIVHTMETIHN